MRRGDLTRMAAVLAPDAVHQGIRSEWRCESAEQILETRPPPRGKPTAGRRARARRGGRPCRHERPGARHRSARGARRRRVRRDQASIVFTLRDGKITRMHDFAHRRDALESAGASPAWE